MYKKSVLGKKANRILLCIGVVFIICVEYVGIDPLIVNFDWKRVSYIAGFYIAPLFELIVLREPSVRSSIISEIGKASFHVFLIQMVYYSYFANKIYETFSNPVCGLLISIVLCSVIGYGFFRVDNKCQEFLSIERYSR